MPDLLHYRVGIPGEAITELSGWEPVMTGISGIPPKPKYWHWCQVRPLLAHIFFRGNVSVANVVHQLPARYIGLGYQWAYFMATSRKCISQAIFDYLCSCFSGGFCFWCVCNHALFLKGSVWNLLLFLRQTLGSGAVTSLALLLCIALI